MAQTSHRRTPTKGKGNGRWNRDSATPGLWGMAVHMVIHMVIYLALPASRATTGCADGDAAPSAASSPDTALALPWALTLTALASSRFVSSNRCSTPRFNLVSTLHVTAAGQGRGEGGGARDRGHVCGLEEWGVGFGGVWGGKRPRKSMDQRGVHVQRARSKTTSRW